MVFVVFVPSAGGLLLCGVREYRGVLNESACGWAGIEVKSLSIRDEGGVRACGAPLAEEGHFFIPGEVLSHGRAGVGHKVGASSLYAVEDGLGHFVVRLLDLVLGDLAAL